MKTVEPVLPGSISPNQKRNGRKSVKIKIQRVKKADSQKGTSTKIRAVETHFKKPRFFRFLKKTKNPKKLGF